MSRCNIVFFSKSTRSFIEVNLDSSNLLTQEDAKKLIEEHLRDQSWNQDDQYDDDGRYSPSMSENEDDQNDF